MARLPHGYTNHTRRRDRSVEKTYVGPHRFERFRKELACLASMDVHLPVARVLGVDPTIPRLELSMLRGDHGQDLIDDGHAPGVLQLVGAACALLQRVPVSIVPGLGGDGPVIVHGDFGPQNVLFDLDAGLVTGVLDWEFAHRGRPFEDLAWAEWIVRMHHPHAVDALDELFRGARCRPPWARRHDAMLRRVRRHFADAERTRTPSPWRDRLDATEAWCE